MTPGSEGYENNLQLFIEACRSLDFKIVCKDFLNYLPPERSNVLDLGSGAGQNSVALYALGFSVTAVEPMQKMIDSAKSTYSSQSVKWLNGSLPHLSCLGSSNEYFDFVLIEAVWHHLNDMERESAAIRLSSIVKKHGNCAISLRNGPAGMGTRVFPIDVTETVELFRSNGFECVFRAEDQDSILAHKEEVKWSRLVLKKL